MELPKGSLQGGISKIAFPLSFNPQGSRGPSESPTTSTVEKSLSWTQGKVSLMDTYRCGSTVSPTSGTLLGTKNLSEFG